MGGADSGRCRGFGSAPTGRLARRSGDFEMSAYRKFVDTLQIELRTPAPPKPPKAPKANPGEPVGVPVLGGLGGLGAPSTKIENSPHATTPPPLSFSARVVWDDFKDEDAANGEHGHD